MFSSFKQIKEKIKSLIIIEENNELIMSQHAELFFSLETLANINVIKLLNKGEFGKVFLINHKLFKNILYAMRVVPKYWHMGTDYSVFGEKKFEQSLNERNIGTLNESPFIVQTYATFQSKVFNNNYPLLII